ncbi:hypothetical protein ACFQFH_07085 [Halobaculum halobium]|uniref:Uncharacterized protein n=1 Tax=Halobaculum halobium TaxID=3032281 RepID=A0ABD5T8H6_9EURY|nr:hypothetical protein [Halobaculum sp. SYNS20]
MSRHDGSAALESGRADGAGVGIDTGCLQAGPSRSSPHTWPHT